MEMSHGDVSPASDLGTRVLAKHPQNIPANLPEKVLTFFLFLKSLKSPQGLLVTYHRWGTCS